MHDSQLETMISAPLSLWQEHHSIELRQQSDNIFVIKDLKAIDFHLISFSNSLFDPTNILRLKLSVKKAENNQTNFTIYLTAGVCVAIIDLDSLKVLFGEVKERQGAVQITKRADGWINCIIEIKLSFSSPIYLGCSLGNQTVYEGYGECQFYIEDSISIEIFPAKLNKQYFNYVKNLTKAGKISEAINFYSNRIEKPLTNEQLYQLIWKSLNEFGRIPEELLKEKKISTSDAYVYFTNNSRYRVVNLSKIPTKINQIFEKIGISKEYLEIIIGDDPDLDEIYINITEKSSEFKFKNKQIRKRDSVWPRLNANLDFQQSMVEKGYIYLPCPFQGKILKSNHSFSPIQSEPHIIAYRFESLEIFYLITGHWGGSKLYLYFPSQELIIYMNEAAGELLSINYTIPIINHLKANFVSHWQSVRQYIVDDVSPKKVVAITGVFGNLGHFWFNNLTGIEYLLNNELLPKLEKILLAQFCYLDISKVFPEIDPSKFISIKDNSIDIFSFCLENNYILVYFSNTYITDNLAEKIVISSINQVETAFLKDVEKAKQNFPLLWINLRSHNKIWVSQVSGYISIINNLAKIYPKLSIIFDGLSAEKEMMADIQSGISNTIQTYSALECNIYESITWAQSIDAYIAVVGSGLTLVTWIANKPGVIHADSAHMGQMLWWKEVRPNIISPLSIPKEYIHDLEPGKSYTDYECDWSMIYELILEIIKVLPPRNNNV